MGGVYTHEGIEQVVELGELIAGGKQELREQPILSFIICLISPLTVDKKYGDFLYQICQHDLPVVERPFLAILENNAATLTEDEFLELGDALKQGNVMRRYSAVLKHVNAGYAHNAMTTWKIGDETAIKEKTKPFINEPAVSHLYLRTIFPGRWEYPLFAMIHARSKEELDTIIENLEKKSGIDDYQILPTLRELKKKRVVYFSPKFAHWRQNLQ